MELEFPLSSFDKSAEACENNFDRWIYLLKHMETIVKLPWPEKNPVFQRLAEISDLGSLSREERMKYDEAIRKYRDTLCVMQSQLDEGIQIGRDQGIQIGRQQTLAEAQMQIQQNLASVARNLKAQHVPLDVIASSTGLSIQEIEDLS
ncbi:MAG: PD-(D/E)XK nuclease family transposase [Parabacteroides sp.]|nr:PD-(D/E)XK nuclease family transposase [Parabacteroides sp.]